MAKLANQHTVQEIDSVIAECKQAVDVPNAYGYLPVIIIALQQMRNNLLLVPIQKQEKRKQEAAGLGRIVLDGTDFADTILGHAIFDIIHHYVDASDDE